MKSINLQSRLILLLFVTMVLQSCQAPTSIPEPIVELGITPEETQIAKDLIQGAFDDLWAGFDSTKIAKYHTDDFIILENGEIWDNNRIKQFMREQLAKQSTVERINKMEYISIDKYGPSIQIAYHNAARFMEGDSLKGKASWLESALAVPTADGWRLKMMHSTWAGNK